jgi:Zn-dependent peptidase ImmA (M78 family)
MNPRFDWTPDRVAFLRANYDALGRMEIAKRWGVAAIVIGRKAFALGICTPASDRANHRFLFTPERLRTLRAEYAEKGAAHFAEQWGMTLGAVTQRAYRMGLTKGNKTGPRAGLQAKADRGARADMRRQQVAKIIRSMEAHTGKRGDAQEIADRIAARKAPDRTCAWRDVGNGFLQKGKPCKRLAVPGRMWCAECQAKVDAVRAAA